MAAKHRIFRRCALGQAESSDQFPGTAAQRPKPANPYETLGAGYFTTWKNGAITIRKVAEDWTIETYQSQKNFLLAEFFP